MGVHGTAWQGKRVLVTGARGEIGSEVCRILARAGADVLASDLATSGTRAQSGAAEGDGGPSGGSPHGELALDVTDSAAVATASRQMGDLDGLFLCHGVTARGRAARTPLAATHKVVEINLLGAINCAQATLPGLLRRRGRIAVLSSVAGYGPLVDRSAYAASKHGIFGYFDTLRCEVEPLGVSVTVVAPSFVATGIEDRAVFAEGAWVTSGEVMSPARAAAAVVTGAQRRRRLVLPSRTARAAWVVSRLAPRAYAKIMMRQVAVRDEGE